MIPLSECIHQHAYATVDAATLSTLAEHVAIQAKLADWHALKRRIEFLTMVAERISFLSVLRHEGITLELTSGGKFVSTPRELDPEIKAWIVDCRAAILAELTEAAR